MIDDTIETFLNNAKLRVHDSKLNVNLNKTNRQRLDEYVEYRLNLKLSKKTVREDVLKLKIFFAWMEEQNTKYEEIVTSDFYRFFNYLEECRKVKMATQLKYLIALKKFFEMFENPVMKPFLEKTEKNYYKKSDTLSYDCVDWNTVELIIGKLAHNTNKNIGFRNMILTRLLFETAGRLNEVLNLKVEDITDYGDVIFKKTKTSKYREVGIDEETLKMLDYFCRLKKSDDYIFTSLKNPSKPMSPSPFRKVYVSAIRELKKENKIPENKRITIHSLRHTQISQLLDKNVPFDEVMEWAGHKHSKTTMRYAHTGERLKKKIPRIRKLFYSDESYINDHEIEKKYFK